MFPFPLPAYGGRFPKLRDPFIVLDGRSAPKPWGARPESVVRPCALHERTELLDPPRPAFPPGCVAYGGRLAFSSDRRPALNPPFAFVIECATVELFARPPKLDPFIVRAARCEAAGDGVVRAITLRFSMPLDGVAILPRIFSAPSALARVGVAWIPFATCAFRNDASVRCCAPRLMAWPFKNVLREAVVTACVLCAYA